MRTEEEGARLLIVISSNKARGNEYYGKYGKFHWNIRKAFSL